jgi:hypothetical protein
MATSQKMYRRRPLWSFLPPFVTTMPLNTPLRRRPHALVLSLVDSVSDQIIHYEICLKNYALSCGGILATFPSSKCISESTIGNIRMSSCQSTIQACKKDSPRLRNLIFPKAVFIKKICAFIGSLVFLTV